MLLDSVRRGHVQERQPLLPELWSLHWNLSRLKRRDPEQPLVRQNSHFNPIPTAFLEKTSRGPSLHPTVDTCNRNYSRGFAMKTIITLYKMSRVLLSVEDSTAKEQKQGPIFNNVTPSASADATCATRRRLSE